MAGGAGSSSVYGNTSSVYGGGGNSYATPYASAGTSNPPSIGLTAPTAQNPYGTFNPYAWQNPTGPSNMSNQMSAYAQAGQQQIAAGKQAQLDWARKSEADYNAKKASADSEWKAKYDALQKEFDTYKSQYYAGSGGGGGDNWSSGG